MIETAYKPDVYSLEIRSRQKTLLLKVMVSIQKKQNIIKQNLRALADIESKYNSILRTQLSRLKFRNKNIAIWHVNWINKISYFNTFFGHWASLENHWYGCKVSQNIYLLFLFPDSLPHVPMPLHFTNRIRMKMAQIFNFSQTIIITSLCGWT